MKIAKIIVLTFCIIILLSQNVFAIGDIFSTGREWMESGEENQGKGINTKSLKNGADDVYNILIAVATGVAVIVGAIIGIKLMASGIEEKVKVKEMLFPYLISCVVVFGSFGIWKISVEVLKGFAKF